MNESLQIVSQGKLLHVKVCGKLTKESYEEFSQLVDQLIDQHGNLRILCPDYLFAAGDSI